MCRARRSHRPRPRQWRPRRGLRADRRVEHDRLRRWRRGVGRRGPRQSDLALNTRLGFPYLGRGHRDSLCYNRRKKPIAAPGNGLNVNRRISAITQRRPDLLDAVVHALLEVHIGLVTPQGLLDLLAGDDLPGAASQHRQQLQWLRRQPDEGARFAQLFRGDVQFKQSKSHKVLCLVQGDTGSLLSLRRDYTTPTLTPRSYVLINIV